MTSPAAGTSARRRTTSVLWSRSPNGPPRYGGDNAECTTAEANFQKETLTLRLDPSRAKRELGWQPRWPARYRAKANHRLVPRLDQRCRHACRLTGAARRLSGGGVSKDSLRTDIL